MPPNTFNGARPGKLGNPFREGAHGDRRTVVMRHYNLLFRDQAYTDGPAPPTGEQWAHYAYVHDNVTRFRGMNGACWCAHDDCCHVNNLLEFFNR